MLRTRLILLAVAALLIWLLFLLPKVVVENKNQLAATTPADIPQNPHKQVPDSLVRDIAGMRGRMARSTNRQKNAIFADSLSSLYAQAGKFDSAAYLAEESATFFNTLKSWRAAGDAYYQAYTFAMDPKEQGALGEKTRTWYTRVLEATPGDLEVKSKMALTYLSTQNPMQGITLLREVLASDPDNEFALYNMGMLSFQSGQYDRAVERLEKLVQVHPENIQGQLLLGVSYMNAGDKARAKVQLEKVKSMDKDPAVQAEVDSYLKDLH